MAVSPVRRARFLNVCRRMLRDGKLDKDEIVTLRQWLRNHRAEGIPGAESFQKTLERYTVDGVVTRAERELLSEALEDLTAGLAARVAEESPRAGRRSAERLGPKLPQCPSCGNRFRLWHSEWIVVGRGRHQHQEQIDVCPVCNARKPRKPLWQAIQDWWRDAREYG